MRFSSSTTKNVFAGLLAGVLLVPSVFFASPQPAHAGWISGDDTVALGKDVFADSLVTIATRITINRLALRAVAWMRGESFWPDGDPGAVFADITNQVSAGFIAELGLGFLCDAWDFDIRLAIQADQGYRLEAECTLEDIVESHRAFVRDFEEGGWEAYTAITLEDANTPFAAYLEAESEVARRIAERVGIVDKELEWGSGILPVRKRGACLRYERETRTIPGTGETETSEPICVERDPDRIVTPGVVMSRSLKKITDLPYDQAVVADEMDAAVGMIAGEFINQVMGQGFSDVEDDPEGTLSGFLDEAEDSLEGLFREALGGEALEIIEKIRDETDRGYLLANAGARIAAAQDLIGATSTTQALRAESILISAGEAVKAARREFRDIEATTEASARELTRRTADDRENMRFFIEEAQGHIDNAEEQAGELADALGWTETTSEQYADTLFAVDEALAPLGASPPPSPPEAFSARQSLARTESLLSEFEVRAEEIDTSLEEGADPREIIAEVRAIMNQLYQITGTQLDLAFRIVEDPADGVSDIAEALATAIADKLTGGGGGGGGINLGADGNPLTP